MQNYFPLPSTGNMVSRSIVESSCNKARWAQAIVMRLGAVASKISRGGDGAACQARRASTMIR
jgi:hypothetical protein